MQKEKAWCPPMTTSLPVDEYKPSSWERFLDWLCAMRSLFDPFPLPDVEEILSDTCPCCSYVQPDLAVMGVVGVDGTVWHFRPIAQFKRWAITEQAGELGQIPKDELNPSHYTNSFLMGLTYSKDELFRLIIMVNGDGLLFLNLHALGYHLDHYANQTVGLASDPEGGWRITTIALDGEGRGQVYVKDSVHVREALANPWLGFIN